MKNNIKLLTAECCEKLLTFENNNLFRSQYNKNHFDLSQLDFLNIPTRYFIDDEFELSTTSNPLSKDDCFNSIKIFQQLVNLDKVQANDKRLWVSLTHALFFEYTKIRWDIDSSSTDATLVSRFHFEGAGIEARMRNSLSRLWWTAKITYNESLDDPFEMTKIIWDRQDIHVALTERSFGTYSSFLHAFLQFYKKNKHLKEDEIRTILKGINAIGGVKVLPLLNISEVIDEIRRVADYNEVMIN